MSLPFAIAYRQPGTPPALEVAPSTVVDSMHKLNPHFTQETLHKNHTFYTDGSKMDNKTVGHCIPSTFGTLGHLSDSSSWT